MRLALAVFAMSIIASQAFAQTEIVVPEDGVHVLQGGLHSLKRLEMRKNSTLKFSGPTNIMATTFVANPGAKIVYESAASRSDTIFNIYTLDASGVQDLTIIGDAKAGAGFQTGQSAARGADGASAKNCRFKDVDGSKASAGAPGGAGAHGQAGEDAVDVSLYLPKVAPGAQIRISAVGGNGGRGQDGGGGGNGGNRSNCHDGRNGGPGGPGGNGGKGGDAGRNLVFIVMPDADYSSDEKKTQIIATTKVDFSIGRGFSGPRGKGGSGGQPGTGAIIGPSGKSSGPDGPDGAEGAQGEGPLPTEKLVQAWSRVEIISANHYAQFIALKVNEAFPR
jgi:hypothetical protein